MSWVRVNKKNPFPTYRQGHIWKVRLDGGGLWWTAFSRNWQKYLPPKAKPIYFDDKPISIKETAHERHLRLKAKKRTAQRDGNAG